MSAKKVVVVGGVAGGMTVASRLKRLEPEADIRVFERGEYISYSACGMPYMLMGKVPAAARLIVRTPEEMREKGVDVRIRHEVTAIDPDARRVTVRDLDGGRTFLEDYDELVLATGARPVVPDLPGRELPEVCAIRRLEDIRSVRHRLDTGARRAVVVGGGYIGLEMAEALRVAGLKTTIVERVERLLASAAPKLSELVHEEMEANGVSVRCGVSVTGFAGKGRLERVLLGDEELPADVVVLALGARPNAELAESVGLTLGPEGAVATDERLRTSREHIYAVGDVTAVRHRLTGQDVWLPLGDTANQQARVLAAVLAGRDARFAGVLGTAIVKVFARGFAKTGLGVEEAEAAGFTPRSALTETTDRAGYYPGAKPLHVLIVWDAESGRILGAQLAGHGDAAKRVDVFAALLHMGATLQDAQQLDLAYAPPYSSALDAVIVAANVAGSEQRAKG